MALNCATIWRNSSIGRQAVTMVRKPALLLEASVAVVAASPDGMGMEMLQAAVPDVPRRSLQRRLAGLVEDGRLIASGQARARKYRVAATMAEPVIAATEPAIPLSPPGREVRTDVRRPLTRRRPVGYRPAFLEDYRPNVSFFLPQNLRDRLHLLGRSPVGDRPAGTSARQVLDRLPIDLSVAPASLEGNPQRRLDTQNRTPVGPPA